VCVCGTGGGTFGRGSSLARRPRSSRASWGSPRKAPANGPRTSGWIQTAIISKASQAPLDHFAKSPSGILLQALGCRRGNTHDVIVSDNVSIALWHFTRIPGDMQRTSTEISSSSKTSTVPGSMYFPALRSNGMVLVRSAHTFASSEKRVAEATYSHALTCLEKSRRKPILT
jgi:hypothetical protein